MVLIASSHELLGARRDELFDLDGDNPRFDVPLKRVKKRRVIQQPLSDVAVEIIKEALASAAVCVREPHVQGPADPPQGDGRRPARHQA